MSAYRLQWRSLDTDWVATVELRRTSQGLTSPGWSVASRITAAPDPIRWALEVDARWHVIRFEAAHGADRLDLSVQDGHWRCGSSEIPELHGVPFVDFSPTPFTNTLPVRGFDWAPGQHRGLSVAHVHLSPLKVGLSRQAYTCLAPDRFRYENLCNGFKAEVRLDTDGFVAECPGLFSRL